MFDIGFWELALIAVVALVVIGPERLPDVARTVGKWVGNARRIINTVQSEINAEVNKADELKRLLEQQSEIKSVHEILEKEVSGGEERKPVPRGKPDYLVKAVKNEANPDVATGTSNKGKVDQQDKSAD